MEEADHRDHRLLCARRVRPGHRRASKPSDELPPPHSITSSAGAAASYDARSKLSQSRMVSVSTESPGQAAWRSVLLGDWNPGPSASARSYSSARRPRRIGSAPRNRVPASTSRRNGPNPQAATIHKFSTVGTISELFRNGFKTSSHHPDQIGVAERALTPSPTAEKSSTIVP